MKCTCPKVRMGKQTFSYYCDLEDHRKLAAGKTDSFSAPRKEPEDAR